MTKSEYVGGGRKVGRAETEEKSLDHEYDPANFYIAAADKDKQSGSLRWEVGRAPFFIIARANKWVEDKRTPYSSIAEFVRDCMIHRDHQLEEFAADPEHDWGPWIEFNYRQKLQQEAESIAREVDGYRDNLSRAAALGDYVWMKELVDSAARLHPKLRPPYNDTLRQLVDSYQHNVVGLGERRAK